MKIISLFAGHDSNITFYDSENNKCHIVELERLTKKRYFRLHVDNKPDEIIDILSSIQNIAKKFWNFDNNYDKFIYVADGWLNNDLIKTVFNTKMINCFSNHHDAHAASAFYQSPFKKSIIISYDGGGNDGFFNIYYFDHKKYTKIKSFSCDFGGGYLLCGSLIKEITESTRSQLAISGKLMGLCGYGKVMEEKVDIFSQFFVDRNYKELSNKIKINLRNIENPWNNPCDNAIFEKQEAFDYAATFQQAFEEAFYKFVDPIMKNFTDLPVCLTGGAALNVLLNEKLKDRYKRPIFIPPNPNDCGLSFGNLCLFLQPNQKFDITYNGLPILDIDNLNNVVKQRKARKINNAEVAQMLKNGKILGLMHGDSEVGPRALGNRSIICDPSYKNMKDILNKKVKFREWYRPFAPFCKKENAHLFFDSYDFDNLEFMSFAPKVKIEYRNKLPSITHIDGTARLQTVTSEIHKRFYDILTEFEKLSEIPILLNTSFNIRGYPILTTIEDALYSLDNTELDGVIIENWLFTKEKQNDKI